MKIHEYQGKDIFKSYGIPIQDGYVIDNTLVQFESLTEDDNSDLTEQIGSFDPTYAFTNESGIAASIFNMPDDLSNPKL